MKRNPVTGGLAPTPFNVYIEDDRGDRAAESEQPALQSGLDRLRQTPPKDGLARAACCLRKSCRYAVEARVLE